jgi:hypothetical protein
MDADGAANRAIQEKRELEVLADFALPCIPLCSRYVGLGLTFISPFACPGKFQMLKRHNARTHDTRKKPPPIQKGRTQQDSKQENLRFSGVCVDMRVRLRACSLHRLCARACHNINASFLWIELHSACGLCDF